MRYLNKLIVIGLYFVCPLHASLSIADESDCLFEFNKAYALNQSGLEAFNVAQQHASEDIIDQAKRSYLQAQELLEQAITHYKSLPDLAYDCSATNLSIAKNNARTASENLELVRISMLGLECLAELESVESLANLASEYYYERQDIKSSMSSAQDALALLKQVEDKKICIGEFQEDLTAQTSYVNRIYDALNEKTKFDNCSRTLEEVLASEERAKATAFNNKKEPRRLAWQEVEKKARHGLDNNECKGIYLTQLKNVHKKANTTLQTLNK